VSTPLRSYRCLACGNTCTIPARILYAAKGESAVVEWPEPRCASDLCAPRGYPAMAIVETLSNTVGD